ncbi:MAG: histidine kinase [Cytophagaceae bacterium SCN 52-12]|nr:MAG: histidine kinase [Cytophagaceae bacterium SCN 52-12]
MKVRQILGGKAGNYLWHVHPHNTVLEALQLMEEKNIGAVLVLENNQLTGIFSERDYARKGILKGRASKDTLIRDVMTSPVITVDVEQKVEDCMEIMSQRHIRHLPVTENETLFGIISINDIVTAIINDQKNRIQSLESYISGGY